MLTFFIVPAEPNGQIPVEVCTVIIILEVDPFIFQGAPEALDKDVILESAFAIHADLAVPGFQNGSEGIAGELAVVAVEDFRSAIFE